MNTRVNHFFIVLLLALFVVMGCKKNDSKTPDPPTSPPPPITLVSPLADTVGGVITITGNNFSAGTTVKFNGVAAVASSINPSEIKVKVPTTATTGKVTVTNNGVAYAYPVDFTVLKGPHQFSMSAAGGMIGATILMSSPTGSSYGTSPVIKFNGITANYTMASVGGYAVVVPAGATSGNVTMTLNGKTYTDGDFKVVNGTFTTYSPASTTGVSDISFDAAGNLYGTWNNNVVKVSPAGVVTTIASVGNVNTFLGGCVLDKAGNVYVSASYDKNTAPPGRIPNTPVYGTDDRKIYKITSAGAVSVFAGTSVEGYVDGPGASAKFSYPTSLGIDAAGNILVSDGQLLRKISPAGVVSTLAGNANVNTTVGQTKDGQGTAATFIVLGKMTLDAAGNIYIADAENRLCKITPAGLVTTIPVIPTDGLSPYLTFLNRLAFDPSGNLYIDVNGAIYVMNKSDVAGSTGIISNTYLNPIGNIGYTLGMTVDASGNLYISNYATDAKYYIVKVMH